MIKLNPILETVHCIKQKGDSYRSPFRRQAIYFPESIQAALHRSVLCFQYKYGQYADALRREQPCKTWDALRSPAG